MKKIFVCSPLSAETEEVVEQNKEWARFYCKIVTEKGHNCIAPHLFYTQFLDDSKPEQRELGLKLGFDWLLECDEVWAFCKNFNEASKGMKREIILANDAGIPVKYLYEEFALGNK